MEEPGPFPQISQILTPGTRSIRVSNSPEFEFCSFSPPDLLSADELFSGGVLLPLHHLRLSVNTLPPAQDPKPSVSAQTPLEPEPETEIPSTGSAQLTPAAPSSLSFSRRWSDIFWRNEKKSSRASVEMDEGDLTRTKEKVVIVNNFKEKKKEKKYCSGAGDGAGVTAAELNINIWPFSRSRSAGNGAARPRPASMSRKASSAPCSRSNSAGESKSRRLPSSPGHGVHVGKSSPVWHARQGGGGGRRSFEAIVRNEGRDGRRKVPPPVPGNGGGHSRARSLSLNIPTYQHHTTSRSAEGAAGNGGGGSVAGDGVRGGSSLFNIKSLFTKKVY